MVRGRDCKACVVCPACCARGRPIIVEWERDARHSAGSLSFGAHKRHAEKPLCTNLRSVNQRRSASPAPRAAGGEARARDAVGSGTPVGNDESVNVRRAVGEPAQARHDRDVRMPGAPGGAFPGPTATRRRPRAVGTVSTRAR
ncbi:hypothetical protein EVAR_98551_1 [Eumeta japonica]|uniref:Uncharacterized protein n=1 Tax=Eumeta variegata TaxID=151549 RepID=A0A4C1YH53_EUMVA|nr:hypothetical protein EVAR_98551_1 [Eumeta japonica]